MEHFAIKYLRKECLPTPFCPGCGIGIIMNCFFKAVEELGYEDLRHFVFCSGIGCSAWIPSPHFKADSIHSLHGRSIPVAIGVKLVKPHLKVVVFGGDGDLAGIGLNHLIHAARRNIEITVIMVNNMIYGMTGGQVAPTTPRGVKTTTTPYGSIETPIDAARIVKEAGAVYVARWTTYHVIPLKNSIKKALNKNGFSFIEVVSQCPTAYGRRAGFKSPVEMLKWFRDNSIHTEKAKNMSEEELEGKIVIGEFVDREAKGLSEKMHELIRKIQEVKA
ncbi:MAG: 2-oxoacid:ferredoxin oxidoreductase subunit beta [Candidatus Methanomethylicota archaeon]|uniref:2-oxoacid:ferredoxin oxidoreductase subunit beta n=1 Tax=Thermoproteota archaeon TaxID=2056631 RepID=A0A497F3V3_9CREN|nr:MAG: 2-oxoacid:ferredoxin oxidoreductase subunit beta [Candidatus Verstraetearchaeota archaeon]